MDNEKIISDMLKKISTSEQDIKIPSVYLEMLGDYNSAIMLEKIIQHSQESKSNDGYFQKSYKEWKDEVYLSQYQVKKAVDKLKKMGLVETKLKKLADSPILHYRPNILEIASSISNKLNY